MAELNGVGIHCFDRLIEIITPIGDFALKSCPFCGGEEVRYIKYQHDAGERFAVTCFGCLATIDPGWAQSKSAVQAMWNTRKVEVVETDLIFDINSYKDDYGDPVVYATGRCGNCGVKVHNGHTFASAIADMDEDPKTNEELTMKVIERTKNIPLIPYCEYCGARIKGVRYGD